MERLRNSETIAKSSTTFQKIKLLVGKNLILRRRHYVMTICEVFLPAIFSFLMSYSRTKYETTDVTNYTMVMESTLIQNFARKCTNESKKCVILYSPNATCNDFMENLIGRLNNTEGAIDTDFNITSYGFDNEGDLEKYYEDHYCFSTEEQVLAAIILNWDCSFAEGTTNYDYTIRFPVDVLGETDKIFPSNPGPGKTCRGPHAVNEQRYRESGFTGLQILIEKAIVEGAKVKKFNQTSYSTIGFPYPEFISMNLSQFYTVFLPQFVAQSFIFVLPSIIRTIVSEKESGIKELMKVMGVPSWVQWIGWAINSLLTTVATIMMIVTAYWISYQTNSVIAVGQVNSFLWLLVLVLYGVAATVFCFFITTFFERSTLATGVGIIIWPLSYYAIAIRLQGAQNACVSGILSFLMPTVGLYYALSIRTHFELHGGADWSEAFDSPSSGYLSFATICIIFICSTIMYSVLVFYFDSVIPTRHSVAKPWNYIFQAKIWGFGNSTGEERQAELMNYFESKRDQRRNRHRQILQENSSELVPGIELLNISKLFPGQKLAVVKNITMTMYHGKITAMVGNNGAGKTTTIRMLTGMLKPSRGIAKVNGYDTSKQMGEIRKSLGYCPQHNLLFDNLTVLEHLTFFSKLKGRSNADVLTEANYYLEKLQLVHKKNAFAKSLSGGQKRKLCLACALAGENKILILDEPTLGLDPQARRAVWDLLLAKRGTSTIFITTHFLEEADIFADQIGIICDGRLKCLGSAWFLKKHFVHMAKTIRAAVIRAERYARKLSRLCHRTTTTQNSYIFFNCCFALIVFALKTCYNIYIGNAGYILKLSTQGDTEVKSHILELVQSHVSTASIMKQYANSVSELNLNIPMKQNNQEYLVGLFTELSSKKAELEIEAIGLSQTTLEDVFLKVVDIPPYGCLETEIRSQIFKPYFTKKISESRAQKSIISKISSEMWALLFKRFVVATRKRVILFCQLVMPVLLMATGILITRDLYQTGVSPGELSIDFRSYNDPITLYSIDDPLLEEHFTDQCQARICEESVDLTSSLLNISRCNVESYRNQHIVALNISESNEGVIAAVAMFSTIPIHAAPLAVNLISNTIMRASNSSNPDPARLRLTIHPLSTALDRLLDGVKIFGQQAIHDSQVPVMFAGFISMGLGVLVATFIVLPSEERLSKIKHIQLMNGVHPAVYWSSFFVCDLILMIISIGLMLGSVPIFERGQTLRANHGLGYLFLICVSYAFAAIPFTYLVSLVVGSIPIGFALISTIHLMSGLAFNVFVSFLEVAQESHAVLGVFQWVARLFPSFGCVRSTMMFVSIGASNMKCRVIFASRGLNINAWCNHTNHPCCESCHEPFQQECVDIPVIDALVWENRNGTAGIGQELTYIIIMAFIYFGILIFIETKVQDSKIWSSNLKLGTESAKVGNDTYGTDDLNEFDIDRMQSKRCNALIANSFCKSYGKLPAISNLCVEIPRGKCFGLMGINGAGKSTLIRLLTGSEAPSMGNAVSPQIEGSHLSLLGATRTEYLRQIGYCPQSEGIIEGLTAEEHLNLIGTLRGVSSSEIHIEVDKWLELTGLSSARSTKAECYSGGMRRRLSIAIAFIGNPAIVILDEPTSGVDALAKRQFWNVVAEATRIGQTVVITSHSFEEYEALCSHIGILVEGKLKCVGKIEEIKKKYIQGFGLTIRTKHLLPTDAVLQEKLNDQVLRSFQPSILKGSRQNFLEYQINVPSLSWSTFFQTMEGIRREYLLFVDEYSVNEVSLEHLLLSFSSDQSEKPN